LGWPLAEVFFFLIGFRRFEGEDRIFDLPAGVEKPKCYHMIDETFVYIGDKRHLGTWLIYEEKYSENYCMLNESTIVWIPSGFVSIHHDC
jgi:hypothetical protein